MPLVMTAANIQSTCFIKILNTHNIYAIPYEVHMAFKYVNSGTKFIFFSTKDLLNRFTIHLCERLQMNKLSYFDHLLLLFTDDIFANDFTVQGFLLLTVTEVA